MSTRVPAISRHPSQAHRRQASLAMLEPSTSDRCSPASSRCVYAHPDRYRSTSHSSSALGGFAEVKTEQLCLSPARKLETRLARVVEWPVPILPIRGYFSQGQCSPSRHGEAEQRVSRLIASLNAAYRPESLRAILPTSASFASACDESIHSRATARIGGGDWRILRKGATASVSGFLPLGPGNSPSDCLK